MTDIRQFDIFPHPITYLRKDFPYLINIQSDYLDALSTRLCASLYRGQPQLAIERLEPIVMVGDEELVLSVLDLATFRLAELGKPSGNIEEYSPLIVAALDIVITGF